MLLIASMLSSATMQVVEYTAQPVTAQSIEIVEVKEETLQEKGERIASEYGVPFSVMDSIIQSESGWNPDPPGHNDGGKSAGLVQINLPSHPEITREQAMDPEFSLRFLASEIKDGREWQWTVCSCVSFAKSIGVKIPIIGNAKNLIPNSVYPRVGGVVILVYNGTYHLAVIERISPDGIHVVESNLERCKKGRRIIKFDNKNIVGYWSDIL